MSYVWLTHPSSSYRTLTDKEIASNYKWEPVLNATGLKPILLQQKGKLASELIGGRNVYVSIATISGRVRKVHETVTGLLLGTRIPSHIFVLLSSEPFLMDSGVSYDSLPHELLALTQSYPVSVVYTDNFGPHRKLLPVLARFWKEDCVIITVDDDKGLGFPASSVHQLIRYFLASGEDATVGLRTKRIGVCTDKNGRAKSSLPYSHWPSQRHGRKEMLVIPTGTGGVLYHPTFFHPVVFDPKLRDLTSSGDDLAFRLASLAAGSFIVSGCRDVTTRTGELQVVCPKSISIRGKDSDEKTDGKSDGKTDKKTMNEGSKMVEKRVGKIDKKGKKERVVVIRSSLELSNEGNISSHSDKTEWKKPSSFVEVKRGNLRRINITTEPLEEEEENDEEDVVVTHLKEKELVEIIGKTVNVTAQLTPKSNRRFHRTTQDRLGSRTNSSETMNTNTDLISSSQITRRLGLFGMNRKENDVMWRAATSYLKIVGVLDISRVFAQYASERNNCLKSPKKSACGLGKCRS